MIFLCNLQPQGPKLLITLLSNDYRDVSRKCETIFASNPVNVRENWLKTADVGV
jgi:hypothetical protein